MNRKLPKVIYCASVFLVVSAHCSSLLAAEFLATTRMGGARDIGAAELPPKTGFLAFGAVAQADVARIDATDIVGLGLEGEGTATLGTVGLLYIWPRRFSVFGGRFATSLTTGYGRNEIEATLSPDGAPPLNIIGEDLGLTDVSTELTWCRNFYRAPERKILGPPPGTIFSLGLGISATVGDGYSPELGSTTSGTETFTSSFAVTHRTQPILLDGTEFSIHSSYNYVNPREEGIGGFEYQDGSYAITDFALTEQFKIVRFGFTGSYLLQLEDDSGSLATPAEQRARAEKLSVGGVVSMPITRNSAVRLKYLTDIEVKNSFESTSIGFSFVGRF